jgi:hypothetical protein
MPISNRFTNGITVSPAGCRFINTHRLSVIILPENSLFIIILLSSSRILPILPAG